MVSRRATKHKLPDLMHIELGSTIKKSFTVILFYKLAYFTPKQDKE